MTKTEKLKQLGYTYNQNKYERFKLENGFIKIIDLNCYDYKLDVGIIHIKPQLDDAKKVYDWLHEDFKEVMRCEDE